MTINRLKKPALIISGLLLFYSIIGFLIIPAVIKAKLPGIIQEQTGRSGAIEQVNFNPFSLELSLLGFNLKEQDDHQDFVNFKELYINTEAVSSLLELALVFQEVRLTEPYVRIEKQKGNVFNFSDLQTEKDTEKPEQEPEGDIFPLKINRLKLIEGHFQWRDAHFDEPVTEPLDPINLTLEGFSTVVDEKSNLVLTLDLGSGGHLEWDGKLSINPLYSNGFLRLANIESHSLWKLAIQDKVGFIIKRGENTLEAEYNFSYIDDQLILEVNDARLDINNLKIAEKGKDKTVIDIPGFAVQGIKFKLAEQLLHIASVTTQDAKLLAWLNPDGTVNYQSLFALASSEKNTVAKKPVAKATAEKEKPWQVLVDSIHIKNYDLQFEDKTTKQPVRIGLSPIDFSLTDFNIKPGSTLPFQLHVSVNQKGRLKAKGSTILQPFSTLLDLEIDDIALKTFQPYIEPFVKLNILDGQFHADGNVQVALPEDGNLQLSYSGNSSISSMHTRDTILRKDFVKWRNLGLSNINFNLQPMRFTVAQVALNRPYARVTVKKDKTTNINDIFAAQKSTEKKPKTKKAKKKPTKTASPYFKISKFTIRKGASDFADYSIILPFEAKMNDLNGAVSGISSEKKSTTNLTLKGKAYDLSPVEIKGQYNPDFSNLDIAMSFTGMPLPYASPYSAEFAGYKIEKGKLSLDLGYKVTNRKLEAENKLVIDQLTLGESVDSPDAVSLPLGLAIALLKDANGVINIDLPVTGSLDDPEFSIWSLLGDAFVNLITKIVSSPFQAMGSLADSDTDYSSVSFAPGVATLDEKEVKKLDELAKALTDRPNLKLEVKGLSFIEQDWPGMQEQALLDQLKKIKQDKLAKEGEKIKFEDIKLSEDEYNDLLADLFIKSFPKLGEKTLFGTPKLINKEDQDFYEVAKNKMASIIEPDQHKLEILASTRSKNIARHLTQASMIDISRVFVLDSKIEQTAKDQKIVSQLSLGAS